MFKWKETFNSGIDYLRTWLVSSQGVMNRSEEHTPGMGQDVAVVPQELSSGQNTTQATCSLHVHTAATAVTGIRHDLVLQHGTE